MQSFICWHLPGGSACRLLSMTGTGWAQLCLAW